jgi:hypothetical protein
MKIIAIFYIINILVVAVFAQSREAGTRAVGGANTSQGHRKPFYGARQAPMHPTIQSLSLI